MSALKSSQIQDMLIGLTKRVAALEKATATLATATAELEKTTSEMSDKVNDLESKEADREAVKEGTWSAVPAGDSDTPISGKIYIMSNDAPVTPENDEEGGDEPEPIGGATYTLKIDEIPSYIPTKDTAETPSYKFIFTPTSDFEFTPIVDEWPSITVEATQTADDETTNTLTYTLTYEVTHNNEKNFILTLTSGEIIFGDATAEPATETKEVVFKSIGETSIPRTEEQPVELKNKNKKH